MTRAAWMQSFSAKADGHGDAKLDRPSAQARQHDRVPLPQRFQGTGARIHLHFYTLPLPDFCPLINRNLAAVQRELSAAGSSANWHLLSISFDPEYDTPARLAEYARPYGIESGHWTFATGATEDIQKLGGAFNLGVVHNGAQIDHTLRTVVVDATGRVQRILVGNDWKAAELIDEMRRAMTVKP